MGFKCAPSLCDCNLTFHLATVTWTFKILTRLYLRNGNLYEVDRLQEYWLGVVTFDDAVMTLTFICLVGLYIGNCIHRKHPVDTLV